MKRAQYIISCLMSYHTYNATHCPARHHVKCLELFNQVHHASPPPPLPTTSSHHHSVSVCLCCVLCAVCCCVYGTYSTVRFGTRTHLLQRLCHHFTPRCAFVLIDRTIDQTGISIFSTFRLFVHRVNFNFFPTLFASLSFCFLCIKSRF